MIDAYLETTPKLTFACAVDWPGWARKGRTPEEALDTLAAYADRYAPVADRASHPLPKQRTLRVVATIEGDATTAFGAPSAVSPLDDQPLSPKEATRQVALLQACWDELDAVAATAPATLRKGPRGGGRDRDAMVSHVVDAERSYARKIGVGLTATEWKQGGVALLRQKACAAIADPPADLRWPLRYWVRRTAWHVLDHVWEMQDRTG